MKDEYNALDPHRQPGPLEPALQGRVEQFYALDAPTTADGAWGHATVSLWAEALSTLSPDTRILMRYGLPPDGARTWYDGQPAAIARSVGRGRITYIGALFDSATLDRAFGSMLEVSGVRPAFGTLPDGVEALRRVGKDHVVYILINNRTEPVDVPLPHPMTALLAAHGPVSSVSLPVQGVEVLEDR
jgi:beta-galactosidase